MQTPTTRLKLGQSATMEQPLIPGLPDEVADQCLLRVAYDHLSLLDSVCRRWRHFLRSADFHARRRLAGITRPLLVLYIEEIQPSYESYVTLFDPVSGTWRLLNRAHALLSSIFRGYQTIIGAGRSMVAIGWRGSTPVRIYNFHTGHWRDGAPIPGRDRNFLAAAWNGASQVFVVSRRDRNTIGYQPMVRMVQSVMCYDVKEDKLEILSDMPTSHSSLAVACHNGAFRRLRRSSGNPGKMQIDSLDESSREWGVEELEGSVHFDFTEGKYAIGEDGIIFCCHGRKLCVKKHGEDGWRDLVDLPSHVENCVYLTSWKGGVLVAGTISQGVRRNPYPALNVYTLMLEENDPTPPHG